MNDALGDVLQRLVAASQRDGHGLPRAPCNAAITPFIWVGEPDGEGWCAWRPVRKRGDAPLAEALGDLCPLHDSIHRYFDSWWFLSLQGRLDDWRLSFAANRPGLEPQAWADLLRDYAAAHGGRLDHVPIGFENRSDLQIVVDNHSGVLSLEDWETGTHDFIAASLDDAFTRMIV